LSSAPIAAREPVPFSRLATAQQVAEQVADAGNGGDGQVHLVERDDQAEQVQVQRGILIMAVP